MKRLVLKALQRLGYQLVKLPAKHDREATAETTASVDISEAVSAFRRDGFVIVRNALSKDWIKGYSESIQAWFDTLDSRLASGHADDSLKIYARQSSVSVSPTSAAETRPPHDVLGFLLQLKTSGIWDAGFLDGELAALVDRCTIRKQNPDDTGRAFDFHQDAPVVYRNEPFQEGLVFWIPLMPVGDDAPGLELIAGNHDVLPHGVNPANAYFETTQRVSGERVAVRMDVGDVLVFSLTTPHRTQIAAGMTKPRISIDLRAVPVSGIPSSYKGLAIIPR